MANPHVTGIAATLMSENRYDNANDVYDAVMRIATRDTLRAANNHDERVPLAYNGLDR